MTQGFGHDHAVRVIKPAATVVLRFGQAQIAQGTEFAKYLMRRENFSSFPFVYMRVDFIDDKALEVTFEFFVFMGELHTGSTEKSQARDTPYCMGRSVRCSACLHTDRVNANTWRVSRGSMTPSSSNRPEV